MRTMRTPWPITTPQAISFTQPSADLVRNRRSINQTTPPLDRQIIARIQSQVHLAQQSLSSNEIAPATEYLNQAVRLLAQAIPLETALPADQASQKKSDSRLGKLSSREREVLQLLVQGKSALNISQLLHLSIATVYTYHQRIRVKLNLHDLPSLTRFALDQQLVT